MRFSRISALGCATLMAGISAPASALAAAPEFNPAKGTHTSKSGKTAFQVQGGAKIECASSTDSGSITGIKTFKLTIDYAGCKTSGLDVNSPGDAKGVILLTLVGVLGYTNKSLKTVGAIDELSAEVELEVPAVKKTMRVKGSAIGEVSPVNVKQTSSKLTLTQKEGKQGIEKLEGGAAQTLLIQESIGGEFRPAGVEISEEITFAGATEITA